MSKRSLFLMLVPAVILCTCPHSKALAGTKPVPTSAYNEIISNFLFSCRFKCSLVNSKSEKLRACAHEACDLADFIRANKKNLIERMQKSALDPKEYKVKLFISQAYRNHNEACQ